MTDSPPNLVILQALNEAGYGFYRNLAKTRADDLMVRSRAADTLHRAAARAFLAEQRARRALPAPTRENPVPPAGAMAAIRELKALQERMARVETRLRGAACLPDRDFSTIVPSEEIRHRLVGLDAALLEQADAVEAHADAAETLLDALDATIGRRSSVAG
jgi:hypothetical protein